MGAPSGIIRSQFQQSRKALYTTLNHLRVGISPIQAIQNNHYQFEEKGMIKNYTSNSKQTFDKIQKVLATHGARRIFFEYGDGGRVKALAFSITIGGKDVSFLLPARVEAVKRIFDREGYRYEEDQPYKTAWANIRDWIDAQMALIDTQQVKMEEVFLPYMAVGQDRTLFDDFEQKHFQLPSSTDS